MPISNKTRSKVQLQKGDPTDDDNGQLASALGVVSTVDSKVEISKVEQDLLQSKALTVEDDPWNQLPNERRTNLLTPTYDPVALLSVAVQNNTLGQCVDALEVNIDGSGYDIERKDGVTPDEEDKDDNIKALKEFFDEAFINESFTSIRRRIRRDRSITGNGYVEVIRNQQGEITLLNYVDAKLVRLVKLDEPVEVERTIMRKGKEQKVRMLVRERRYAQLIGNKVRYFRDFGSSREVNAETGEWMGKAKKAPPSTMKAPSIKEKQPPAAAPEAPPVPPGGVQSTAPVDLAAERAKRVGKAEFPGTPEAGYSAAPAPEDDPTKRPQDEAGKPVAGNELIHFMDVPDITTPYGVPRWLTQMPSALGSRKAEELNLEYFNHGGLPPVMIFLQGGQLAKQARDKLNSYLSGEAKGKLRGVVCEVFATGGDLSSNSSVKTSVERFGGDNLQDSMFEGYDERCANRVRSSFRLPPLFTGDTSDYTFATAYASYVVAEAQVFKPERELFDERINNTVMKELAPEYVYRSLPLTVHDVAVQIQALTLAKDVVDRSTFVDEVNEIAGLNLTMQDPLTDPMNPMAGLMPGAADPFGKPKADNPFGAKPNPFDSKTKMPAPVKGGGDMAKKPLPSGFAKASRERIAKALAQDDVLVSLVDDWAAHLAGEREFEAESVNTMSALITSMHPQVRKMFNASVGVKLAPGAKYDPDGMADLLACAGDCLN